MGRADRLRADTAGVAIRTRHLGEVPKIYRVRELAGRGNHRCSAFLLGKDCMAGIAIFWNNFALRTNVLPVVAAETSARV